MIASKVALLLAWLVVLPFFLPEDPKKEAARTAAMAEIEAFFDAIPKDKADPNDGNCYRAGSSRELVLEISAQSLKKEPKTDAEFQEFVFKLLGTWFNVGQLRSFSGYGILFTCKIMAADGSEVRHATIGIDEVLPHFHAHSF